MIHVVVMKRLIGLPLLIHIDFYGGVGVLKIEESGPEVLKIEESESELLCTDSTALLQCVITTYQTTMCHNHISNCSVITTSRTTVCHNLEDHDLYQTPYFNTLFQPFNRTN
jgi:hypothetical protein